MDTAVVETISGLTAGMVTTLVAHPLDFFKLRLQLDTSNRSQIESFKGIYRHLVTISSSRGMLQYGKLVKNVYRGLGPNLIGSTSAWGMYFASYRQFKELILWVSGYPRNSHQNLSSWDYLGAAFAAGWSTSIVTNPIWVIKTRMICTDRGASGAYSSIWHGIKQIYSESGVLGFYRGLSPALLNVAQGAAQLSIYDLLKRYKLRLRSPKVEHQRLTTFEYLYLSALSKMMATCVFYPLQVIRSRLQISLRKQSAVSLSLNVLKAEGIKGFYKGLGANLGRVVPATCLTFVVYEEMKHLLGL